MIIPCNAMFTNLGGKWQAKLAFAIYGILMNLA